MLFEIQMTMKTRLSYVYPNRVSAWKSTNTGKYRNQWLPGTSLIVFHHVKVWDVFSSVSSDVNLCFLGISILGQNSHALSQSAEYQKI